MEENTRHELSELSGAESGRDVCDIGCSENDERHGLVEHTQVPDFIVKHESEAESWEPKAESLNPIRKV